MLTVLVTHLELERRKERVIVEVRRMYLGLVIHAVA
jgi:hypothetical protein